MKIYKCNWDFRIQKEKRNIRTQSLISIEITSNILNFYASINLIYML